MSTYEKLEARQKEIGARLKQARELAGLSATQAAKLFRQRVGWTVITSTMWSVEAGEWELLISEIVILAEIYGANVDYLLSGVNPDFDPQSIADLARGKLSPNDFEKLLELLEVTQRSN